MSAAHDRDRIEELLEELCGEFEAAERARQGWHDRLWAAGLAATRFLAAEPTRGRFLLGALEAAGGDAQARRDRLVERLADLIDGGRAEASGDRPLSRCSAEIAAGSVYTALLARVEDGSLERGDEFLPELVYLAALPYLGAAAAEGELRVLPLR